jgi:hypothetical protein
MTLSRDLSVSSFHIPRRVSADLCLHVVTLRVQVCTASPAIFIFAHFPSHDSHCSGSRHSEPRAPNPFHHRPYFERRRSTIIKPEHPHHEKPTLRGCPIERLVRRCANQTPRLADLAVSGRSISTGRECPVKLVSVDQLRSGPSSKENWAAQFALRSNYQILVSAITGN